MDLYRMKGILGFCDDDVFLILIREMLREQEEIELRKEKRFIK